MKSKYTFIVLLLTFFLLNSAEVLASRAFLPAKIPPIIYKDIKIVADNSSLDKMGIVQAFDKNTNNGVNKFVKLKLTLVLKPVHSGYL